MRMPKAGQWELTLDISAARGEQLARITCGDAVVLDVVRRKEGVTARAVTRWDGAKARFHSDAPLEYALRADVCVAEALVEWRAASIRLYADGLLADEDWYLGAPARGMEWELTLGEGVEATVEASPVWLEDAPEPLETAQYWSPRWPNANIGDCMPFAQDGQYHLYCLFDRRHHRSKQGLGAHQWAHLSTDDLSHWTMHRLAVGIDEMWEGSICTGSLIERDGVTYAFYAVRMSDGSPARLTWAESRDGVRFVKSGRYHTLTAPYDAASARDPKVWQDDDGLYHMLVTTSLLDGARSRGCLAHLTSEDMAGWTQREPMLALDTSDQPECSDYFRMGGLYYLVYSIRLQARYCVSESPFGPWRALTDEPIDSAFCAVPKTAMFGDRRLVSSWIGRGGWGGFTVTHELTQRRDGTLGTRLVEELTPALPRTVLDMGAGHSKAEVELGADFDATLSMDLSGGCTGRVQIVDADETFTLTLDGKNGTARLAVAGGEAPDRALKTALPAGLTMSIRLIACGDALDIALPDDRMMTLWRTRRAPVTLKTRIE